MLLMARSPTVIGSRAVGAAVGCPVALITSGALFEDCELLPREVASGRANCGGRTVFADWRSAS
jgi:hypothetical protein